MKKKYYLEGMLGLLSLLGFVGVFTEERMFLAFFAFACNFQYFFIPADPHEGGQFFLFHTGAGAVFLHAVADHWAPQLSRTL